MKKFKEYLAQKKLYESNVGHEVSRQEYNKKLNEGFVSEDYNAATSYGAEGAFTATVCGILFGGPLLMGSLPALLPLLGIAAGVGAAGTGLFFLGKKFIKDKKKAKITEFAEQYKKEYKALQDIGYVEFPAALEKAVKKKGAELEDQEIKEIGEKFLKKKELHKEKCKAIEKDCDAWINEKSIFKGNGDPELKTFKDLEFIRVKQEVLKEQLEDGEETLTDEEREALEKKKEQLETELEEVKEEIKKADERAKNGIKKGDIFKVSKEDAKALVDAKLAEEVSNESAIYESKDDDLVKVKALYSEREDGEKYLKDTGVEEDALKEFNLMQISDVKDYDKKKSNGDAYLWYNKNCFVKLSEDEKKEMRKNMFNSFEKEINDKLSEKKAGTKEFGKTVLLMPNMLKNFAEETKNDKAKKKAEDLIVFTDSFDLDKAKQKESFKVFLEGGKQADEPKKYVNSVGSELQRSKGLDKISKSIDLMFVDNADDVISEIENADDSNISRDIDSLRKKYIEILNDLKNS